MKGVVLQTFGAGNAPSEPPLLRELKDACDRGMVIVNCTQCVSGNVSTTYPAAKVSVCICVSQELIGLCSTIVYRSSVSWGWCLELT